MQTKKYICVEDYIDRFRAYPTETKTTLGQVFKSMGNEEPADVIPVEWVENWFKEHYHTDASGLISDWRKQQ